MPKSHLRTKVTALQKFSSTSNHPILQKTLGYCLQKAAQQNRSLMDSALEPYGLLSYQYTIIRLLAHSGPCSQIEIGNYLSIDKASMVRFLDSLEKEEYLQRTPSKDDRRIKNVGITSKGIKMHDIAEKLIEQVQEEFLSPLTSEERKAYSTIIPKLIKSL